MDPIAKQQIKNAPSFSNVELDLSKVENMDSCGIDLIFRLYKELKKKDGRLKVIGVRKNLMEIIEISNLQNLVEVIPIGEF